MLLCAAQFCHWAIQKNLDLDDDDDFVDSAAVGHKYAAEGAGHAIVPTRIPKESARTKEMNARKHKLAQEKLAASVACYHLLCGCMQQINNRAKNRAITRDSMGANK